MIGIVRNLIYVTALLVSFSSLANEMWRGLVVAHPMTRKLSILTQPLLSTR
ncbi:hypothetical protein VCRA2133E348_590035 [Vibrio crassostreae]|nr:hypothetical protein VCRA2119O48_570034 [Vibrio crassostreae]CAK3046574.1 hypothetical protein VCRA2133E348_590035 [Vibrio crassostreae]CAK3584265.1 hypothetical protein VCRA213O314_640018 [Vibrio crassostreae]CAK3985344.1 hypothetical protein VCRA212O16_550034 [Vibrio crassostreae]